MELLDSFVDATLTYIPREQNFAAKELAQLATGITLAQGVKERILKVERRTLLSFAVRREDRGELLVAANDIDIDWRDPIIAYLRDPSAPSGH